MSGRALPPAIVIGGSANALSIARSLGRRGVQVRIVNSPGNESAYSRYARFYPIASGAGFEAAVEEFLLGAAGAELQGSVLLTASDEGINVLAANRDELARRYRLDLSDAKGAVAMLDKRATYEIARAAGVATPRFWRIGSAADIETVRGDLVFPLIVKPLHTHVAEYAFGAKFVLVTSLDELGLALAGLADAGIASFLVEHVPGPDTNLASYYTYLDEDGEPQFDFTKRIIRRSPSGMGLATYHVTDRVEGLREPALALLRAAGVRGVANVEFKTDPRDGTRRLMECNARFTAANCLLTSAGVDLSWYVYARACGLPLPAMDSYRTGVTLWDPVRDLKSYHQLRGRGEIDRRTYVRSVLRRQTLPTFAWDDPQPAIRKLVHQLRSAARSAASTPLAPADAPSLRPDRRRCRRCWGGR